MQGNMAAGASLIKMDILLPIANSKSVPRSRSKASTNNYAKQYCDVKYLVMFPASLWNARFLALGETSILHVSQTDK